MLTEMTKYYGNPPLLNINFISHGTLESKDLEASRRFYEEVLGFEVIQTMPRALMFRRGGQHVYVVVQTDRAQGMTLFNHNGLDVESEGAVLEAHRLLQSVQEEYGILKILKPHEQHGVFSFYFQDMDGNWWEILANPPGGYSQMFENPELDLTDRTG